MDREDLLRRAMAAYFKVGGSPDQPSKASEVVSLGGLNYVVLRGGRGSGPLAVYRVKADGILRRLKRWPADIE